jgi:hypothetical protein
MDPRGPGEQTASAAVPSVFFTAELGDYVSQTMMITRPNEIDAETRVLLLPSHPTAVAYTADEARATGAQGPIERLSRHHVIKEAESGFSRAELLRVIVSLFTAALHPLRLSLCWHEQEGAVWVFFSFRKNGEVNSPPWTPDTYEVTVDDEEVVMLPVANSVHANNKIIVPFGRSRDQDAWRVVFDAAATPTTVLRFAANALNNQRAKLRIAAVLNPFWWIVSQTVPIGHLTPTLPRLDAVHVSAGESGVVVCMDMSAPPTLAAESLNYAPVMGRTLLTGTKLQLLTVIADMFNYELRHAATVPFRINFHDVFVAFAREPAASLLGVVYFGLEDLVQLVGARHPYATVRITETLGEPWYGITPSELSLSGEGSRITSETGSYVLSSVAAWLASTSPSIQPLTSAERALFDRAIFDARHRVLGYALRNVSRMTEAQIANPDLRVEFESLIRDVLHLAVLSPESRNMWAPDIGEVQKEVLNRLGRIRHNEWQRAYCWSEPSPEAAAAPMDLASARRDLERMRAIPLLQAPAPAADSMANWIQNEVQAYVSEAAAPAPKASASKGLRPVTVWQPSPSASPETTNSLTMEQVMKSFLEAAYGFDSTDRMERARAEQMMELLVNRSNELIKTTKSSVALRTFRDFLLRFREQTYGLVSPDTGARVTALYNMAAAASLTEPRTALVSAVTWPPPGVAESVARSAESRKRTRGDYEAGAREDEVLAPTSPTKRTTAVQQAYTERAEDTEAARLKELRKAQELELQQARAGRGVARSKRARDVELDEDEDEDEDEPRKTRKKQRRRQEEDDD